MKDETKCRLWPIRNRLAATMTVLFTSWLLFTGSRGLSSEAAGAQENESRQQATIGKLLQDANKAVDAGDARLAESLYLKVVALSKTNVEAQKRLARLYYLIGEIEKAKTAFERLRERGAIDFHRSDKDSLIYLGRCYLDSSKYAEAVLHFLQMAKYIPDDPDILYYLGQACSSLGRSSYARIKEVDPASYRIHLILGENFLVQNQTDKALAEFQAAKEKELGLPGASYQLGALYYQKNELEKAAQAFADELSLNPLSFDAYLGAGVIHLELALQSSQPDRSARATHLPSSIQYLERAGALHPQSWTALFHLGKALFENGQLTESMSSLKKAAQLAPEEARTYYLMAEVYKKQGEQQAAIEALRRFQELTEKADRQIEQRELLKPAKRKTPR